jgi:hypothetical protein
MSISTTGRLKVLKIVEFIASFKNVQNTQHWRQAMALRGLDK